MAYYACLVNYEELLLGFEEGSHTCFFIIFHPKIFENWMFKAIFVLLFFITIFVQYNELIKYCISQCYLFI